MERKRLQAQSCVICHALMLLVSRLQVPKSGIVVKVPVHGHVCRRHPLNVQRCGIWHEMLVPLMLAWWHHGFLL